MELFSGIRDFTYQLELANSSNALQSAIAKLVGSMGFEYYMYNVYPSAALVNTSAGQDMVLTNFPVDWMSHYIGQGYAEVDPALKYVVSKRRGCIWDKLISTTNLTKRQEQLQDDAGAARISGGLTLPIASRHGEFATFICVPEKSFLHNDERLELVRPMLDLVANYLHAKALKIMVGERLAAQKQLLGMSLSPREREVLYWASLGKTGWETGAILGISQKSAEMHAENAKNKLEAANKTHAVAKAISRGLIPDLREVGVFEALAVRMGLLDGPKTRALGRGSGAA